MYSGSSRDDEAHLHTLELLPGAQSLLQQLEEEKGGWGANTELVCTAGTWANHQCPFEEVKDETSRKCQTEWDNWFITNLSTNLV